MGEEHSLAEIVLQCLTDDRVTRPTAQEIVRKLDKEIEKIDRKRKIAFTGRAKLSFLALGEAHVGKTCILQRFVNPQFNHELVDHTVGIGSYTTTITHNGIAFGLYLVDTAGQERFSSIPPLLLRESDAVFLVFDISDRRSYTEIPQFIQMVEKHSRYEVSLVLVGNKVDIASRKVPQEEAREFAREHAMPYIETSVKTGQNIEHLFEQVVQMVYDRLDLADIHVYFPDVVPPRAPQGICGKLGAWFGSSS